MAWSGHPLALGPRPDGLREDETDDEAAGKNVFVCKHAGFVLGAVIMGIGGAMYAYADSSLTPEAFTHSLPTFLFWAMVMIGGSGNNKGAVAGAYVALGVLDLISRVHLQGYNLRDMISRAACRLSARDFTVGSLIVGLLLMRPWAAARGGRVCLWVDRRCAATAATANRRRANPARTDEGPKTGEPLPLPRSAVGYCEYRSLSRLRGRPVTVFRGQAHLEDLSVVGVEAAPSTCHHSIAPTADVAGRVELEVAGSRRSRCPCRPPAAKRRTHSRPVRAGLGAGGVGDVAEGVWIAVPSLLWAFSAARAIR